MSETRNKRVAVSLVSKAYYPWAFAQFDRLSKLQPDANYTIFTEEQLRAADWAFQYPETTRLLFANRPKCVLKLFEQGAQEVLFLGADVYFTAAFWNTLELYPGDCVVTPHITEPLPLDLKRPTTTQIHMTGQLNSDFVLWRNTEETRKFLQWQADMLEVVCKDDIAKGHFFDQVYLSYAPYFLQANILKHPGFNVAYWNLPHRNISKGNVYDYYVNELVPLYCFQFSGFSLDNPYKLSKYTTRHELQTFEVYTLMQEFTKCLEFYYQLPDSERASMLTMLQARS